VERAPLCASIESGEARGHHGEGVWTTRAIALSMERKKTDGSAEDFEAWKILRGAQEETHQAEFALK